MTLGVRTNVSVMSQNCFSAFPQLYNLNTDISEVLIFKKVFVFLTWQHSLGVGFNFLPILLSKTNNYTPRQFWPTQTNTILPALQISISTQCSMNSLLSTWNAMHCNCCRRETILYAYLTITRCFKLLSLDKI